MTRDYFNHQATNWDNRAVEKDGAKLKDMVSAMRIPAGAHVLDIGTGTGVLVPHLLHATGPSGRVYALDYASQMLRMAKAKSDSDCLDFVLADALQLPFRQDIFDAVVCYSTFPHFADKPRALAEIARILVPGGRLCVCHTASRQAINHRHRHMDAVKDDLLPDAPQFTKWLEAAGYNQISVEDGDGRYVASAMKSEL